MWRLLRHFWLYYRKAVLVSWGFSAAGTFLVLAIVAFFLPSSRGALVDHGGASLGYGVLVASMIVAFAISGTEKEEKRLLLLVSLPVPLRNVALLRVLLPAAGVLGGTVLAAVLVALGALAGLTELTSTRLYVPALLGGSVLLLTQLPLAFGDFLERLSTGRYWKALGTMATLSVLVSGVFSAQGFLDPRPLRLLVIWLGSAILLGLNVLLFEHRRSFR